jgi:hypothetical protein
MAYLLLLLLQRYLGRSTYSEKMCSCCSVLEQDSNGFIATLLMTSKNCSIGVKKMAQLYKQPNMRIILSQLLLFWLPEKLHAS